jgi:hypothetical protein
MKRSWNDYVLALLCMAMLLGGIVVQSRCASEPHRMDG